MFPTSATALFDTYADTWTLYVPAGIDAAAIVNTAAPAPGATTVAPPVTSGTPHLLICEMSIQGETSSRRDQRKGPRLGGPFLLYPASAEAPRDSERSGLLPASTARFVAG